VPRWMRVSATLSRAWQTSTLGPLPAGDCFQPFATLVPMTPQGMSLDQVATLAAASVVPLRERLIGAMRGRAEALEVQRAFPADQALASYLARLQLWQDDVLPTMAGFPEFVAAIESAGSAEIAMAVHEERERNRRFILLFDGAAASLLGAVELAVDTADHHRADDDLLVP
jgi:hypothetical protein